MGHGIRIDRMPQVVPGWFVERRMQRSYAESVLGLSPSIPHGHDRPYTAEALAVELDRRYPGDFPRVGPSRFAAIRLIMCGSADACFGEDEFARQLANRTGIEVMGYRGTVQHHFREQSGRHYI